MKQFHIAYKGWKDVNVHWPWERARAISFYAVVPHTKEGSYKSWDELFPLEIDKLRKKKKKKSGFKAYVTEMTQEEKQLYETILRDAKPING